MKRLFFTGGLMILLMSLSCHTTKWQKDALSGASMTSEKAGNSLFHRTQSSSMPINTIELLGEVANTGVIDLHGLYKREVFVKEAFCEDDSVVFKGAWRYSGYSLFDLLNAHSLQKKNVEAFRPPIDVYVIIRNAGGESVVFSWAEIFYSPIPHQIIIATDAAPIDPQRKKVAYERTVHSKLVCATDLYAFRNLDQPVSIEIKSFDRKDYPVTRHMDPMYSRAVQVVVNDKPVLTIDETVNGLPEMSLRSVFFGMGMGFHPSAPFYGPELAMSMPGLASACQTQWVQHGLVCFAGIDGYRTLFSYSELFNRNDQSVPILDKTYQNENGGLFRLFHPADFYADRSVKSLAEIYLFLEE